MRLFNNIFKKKNACKQDQHRFVNGRCAVCGKIKGQHPISFADDTWHYDLTFVSPQDQYIRCLVCHEYTPHLVVDCKGLRQELPANPKMGITYPFPEKHYSICLVHQDNTYCPSCNAFVLAEESAVGGKNIWTCKKCGGEVIFQKGESPQ